MPRISTDKLLAGMILKVDVTDPSGRMLLKSGIEIEEKHLKILRTWGVMGVEVESDEDVAVSDPEIQLSDLPSEIIAAIEGEIEERFVGVDTSHPVMVALIDEVKRDLIKQQLNEARGR